MKTEIHYFSGTGNSLVIARDLVAELNAELIPIASLQNLSSIKSNADAIGIVTPNYYGDLPPIIKRFAEKLSDIEDKYIFGLCTYPDITASDIMSQSAAQRS